MEELKVRADIGALDWRKIFSIGPHLLRASQGGELSLPNLQKQPSAPSVMAMAQSHWRGLGRHLAVMLL
jgi:hypothetical protein